MLDGGVLPVVKHIPGHGRAAADSHYDLPRVSAPIEALEARDFAPFKALSHMPMGMTAHIALDALDPAPATLSPVVMELIRSRIGFENLIMTDDIAMKALQGPLGDRARQAIAAGCDVILHCNGTLQERTAVADAAGEMTPLAQQRAQRALAMRQNPVDIDIPAALAQLETLFKEADPNG
jgi:beta-N-acetylhexosaminidase